MHCQACGSDLPAESQFCPQCGAKTSAAAESAPPPAAEKFREAGQHTGSEEAEVDLWTGGYSGKAMIGNWLLAGVASIGLIVLGVLVPALFLPILVAIPLIWITLFAVLVWRKMSVHYLLTSQRFIHRTGILKRVTDRIEVIDIDDVTFEQGIVQRLVGVGTIKISSSDRTHPELTLYGIDEVREIADQIDEVRRKERRQRGLHIEAI